MPGDSQPPPPTAPPAPLAVVEPLAPELVRRTASNATSAHAAATRAAYAGDWRRFVAWCNAHGLTSIPAAPDTVAIYLTWLSEPAPGVVGKKLSTIRRAYASIRVANEAAGHPMPTYKLVSEVLKAVARRVADLKNTASQKRALEIEQVVEACGKLPQTLAGARDRAVLLFGFALAQRRADIAAVRLDDLTWIPEGIDVRIRRSKTDQFGKGHTVAVLREGGPGCPVAAVEAWIKLAPITEGFLVRRLHRLAGVTRSGVTGNTIAAIVKQAAASLGLDPKLYGGHSLRRGYVTTTAKAGYDLDAIMKSTGHRSVEQMRTYIDESVRVQRTPRLFGRSPRLPVEINASEMPSNVIDLEGQRLVRRPRKPS